MKGVLVTGAAIAVVDGVVLGVALGVDRLVVATTALAVGLVAAFVLGLLTPPRPAPDAAAATATAPLITLGTRPTPEPAEPDELGDGLQGGLPGGLPGGATA